IRQNGAEVLKSYEGRMLQYLQATDIPHPPMWLSSNLEAYEVHPGPKLLMYYEDLVQSPEQSITKIGAFFKVEPEKVRAFLDQLDHHRDQSLAAYQQVSHQSMTQGAKESMTYHQQGVSPELTQEFWDSYRQLHPGLVSQYLKRYVAT
ncbi:MAG: hypothetical protein AAFQ98_23115, partial [Bacteroidota bacterium]